MSGSVHRRDFLLGAAAIAASAAAGRTAIAASRNRQEPVAASGAEAIRSGGFKKSLKLGMVTEGATILEKFQLVKEIGFDGIEMNSPNGYSTKEVLAARDATGLPIHGVVDSAHWGKPFSSPNKEVRAEGVTALRTALADAQTYGASTVLVVPAVVSKGVSYRSAWERAHEEISKVLPEAEERGIHIAFENVWNNFLLSPVETAYWIDSFESPMVGMYFDVGNIVRYGWPAHWVEALAHRILKIDVKGYSRKLQMDKGPWKGFGVGIHDGDCDWKEVVKALKETGYAGWFTLEVGGGGREHLTKLAADVDRIFES